VVKFIKVLLFLFSLSVPFVKGSRVLVAFLFISFHFVWHFWGLHNWTILISLIKMNICATFCRQLLLARVPWAGGQGDKRTGVQWGNSNTTHNK